MTKVLITGGAGFIGSHTVDFLIKKGFEVNVIDNLNKYVHINKKKPDYLNPKAKYFFKDLRDDYYLKKALKDVEYVIHDASMVGTGQSMFNFDDFINSNISGISSLWHVIITNQIKLKKFILASSVSVYGEGAYQCEKHGVFYPKNRKFSKTKNTWDIFCPQCNKISFPIATSENSNKDSRSVYSLTKQHQEEISLMLGKTYGIETIICRYFNCYGSRLSLNNPYTGVSSIFINNIMNNLNPVIFEDGNQLRDYIHVSDLVNAKYLLLKNKNLKFNTYNIGTGKPISLLNLIEKINYLNKSSVKPNITNEYRVGDIRSSYANIKRLKGIKFKQKISIEKGLEEMIDYARNKKMIKQINSYDELKRKGLIVS